MAEEKREKAIERAANWLVGDQYRKLGDALGMAYDAALADNAERVRETEDERDRYARANVNLYEDWLQASGNSKYWHDLAAAKDKELAEARATIEKMNESLDQFMPPQPGPDGDYALGAWPFEGEWSLAKWFCRRTWVILRGLKP